MSRARWFVLGVAGVLCLMLVPPRTASAYQQSDLQGTWEFNSIASGPGAPWWERARALVAADGSFTALANDNGGGADTIQSEFDLSSEGIVTLGGLNTFRGALDTGMTLLASTDTWSSGGAGTTELRIGVKLAPTYALSDLAGDWELNIIASGPGAPWWERGRVTVAANGTFSGLLAESDGQTDPATGTFNLTPAGVITFSGSANARGALDAHKSVLVMTSTWTGFAAGTVDLAVGVKMAASYTLADLVGTWEVHSLATGPGAPHWTRTHLSVAADGGYVSSNSESNGGSGSSSGTLSISPAGVLTRSESSTARGVLDSGKTAMVWTDVWTTQSPGTTEIEVALKTNIATTDVPPAGGLGLAIDPVHPNPMRTGALTVHFVLPTAAPAQIELLDVSGRRVVSRDLGSRPAGRHALDLSAGRPLAPGLYLVRVRQGVSTRATRVIVLR